MNFDLMYSDKGNYVSNIRYCDVPLTNDEVIKLLNKLTKEQIEKGDSMDTATAKDKILAHNKRIQDARIQKALEKEKETEKLIAEIKALKPRIKQIIEIGNLCLENNIPIWKRYGVSCNDADYKKGVFDTDGIRHQLGFYPNNHNRTTNRSSHYDYIGYIMGGACGNRDFITDGDLIADTPNRNKFAISSINEPSIKNMKKFLKDFPKFEKAFYDFINKL